MAEKISLRGVFEFLAAGEMAKLVVTCGTVLIPGPVGLLVPAAGKAVEYFGPTLARRFIDFLFQQGPPSRAAEVLETLANADPVEVRAAARDAVRSAAPSASVGNQEIAAQYLAGIPGAVRASLLRDEGGRSSCPLDLVPRNADEALRLMPAAIPPFLPPCDLPRSDYQLIELVGTGGFGAVYLARHRTEYEPRAIKVCLDPERARWLRREQELLKQLVDHGGEWSENIVRLYGHELDTDLPFLVYEYVKGGDLAAYVHERSHRLKRPLDAAEVLGAVEMIARGLAVAHPAGLVHRDLKPGNVLWSGKTLKLTDFGLGAVACNPNAARRGGPVSPSLGPELRGSGTPLYMCEEQRKATRPDPRHDIYSLGVIWYQMLVGDFSRRLTPGWEDELREHNVPRGHIELLGRCIRGIDHRPAGGRELLNTIGQLRRGKRGSRTAMFLAPVAMAILLWAVFTTINLGPWWKPVEPDRRVVQPPAKPAKPPEVAVNPPVETPKPAETPKPLTEVTKPPTEVTKPEPPAVVKDSPPKLAEPPTVAVNSPVKPTKPPEKQPEPAPLPRPTVGDFTGTWQHYRNGELLGSLTLTREKVEPGSEIGAVKAINYKSAKPTWYEFSRGLLILRRDEAAEVITLVKGRPQWGRENNDGSTFTLKNIDGPATGTIDEFRRVDGIAMP